jgi:predicted dehydrogenase
MIGSEDRVQWQFGGNPREEMLFKKTRPDDFIAELKHVDAILKGEQKNSAISLECGLDTMLVVAAAHLANRHGRRVFIDYTKGYSAAALTLDPSC